MKSLNFITLKLNVLKFLNITKAGVKMQREGGGGGGGWATVGWGATARWDGGGGWGQ